MKTIMAAAAASHLSLSVMFVALVLVSICERVYAEPPPCRYEVTATILAPECGIHGDMQISVTGMSEDATIVGFYDDCDFDDQPFLWTIETGFVALDDIVGGEQGGRALAAGGNLIVGYLNSFAFVYDYQRDIYLNLGTFPGGNQSRSTAANSVGQVVGYWGNTVTGPWQAFVWDNGEMIDLGPAIGGDDNRAFAINDAGVITGWWQPVNNGDKFAFLFHDGEMIDLGPIPGGFESEGRAINSHGDIAGKGRIYDEKLDDEVKRAFARIDGEMIVLGTLPGLPDSSATGINDDRTVVGSASALGGRAFVWKDGVMRDLNDLVPLGPGMEIKYAQGINAAGQIAADGTVGGSLAGWLLTPAEGPLGDLDGDCIVGSGDLVTLLGQWGRCPRECIADLDGDGVVGTSDLILLLGNWG